MARNYYAFHKYMTLIKSLFISFHFILLLQNYILLQKP